MIRSDILKIAFSYIELGWSIIPVGRNKRPLIKWEQYQKKIADKNTIAKWYSKNPHAGIGIVTGKISNLTVLDADNEQAFKLLNSFLPDSLEIPTVKTPKGKHLYFEYTPELHNTVRTLGTQLDIRNDGGYVVAPPSKNSNGLFYEWNSAPSSEIINKIPSMLVDILIQSYNNTNNNIYINTSGGVLGGGISRGISSVTQKTAQQSITTTLNSNNNNNSNIEFLCQGRRDSDLFHTANCLFKGGMKKELVYKVVELLGKNCTPEFSQKEARIKVESAFQRVCNRDEFNMHHVREFVSVTSGNFSITEALQTITTVTPKTRAKIRVYLSRLVNDGVIERVGQNDGWFRRVDNVIEKIDLIKINESEFKLKLPLDLDRLIIPQPKNIVIFAGERNAGKSCFCLNIAKMNVGAGYPVRYLTSEMGGVELKHRLKKFEPDWPYEAWYQVDFFERASDFHDILEPDGLTIIDYLKLEDQFYLVGAKIRRIFQKLKNGIVVIALQKSDRSSLGVGGQFTLDEARLYVTLMSNPPAGGIAKIEKAKNWRTERNPNALQSDFKIVNGSKILMIGDWYKNV